MPSDVRIRSVCQLLIERAPSEAFAIHIARVLARITPKTEWEKIHTPHEAIDAFRRKGLIPPHLVALFATSQPTDGPPAEAMAVSFAACLYPQRAYQLRPLRSSETIDEMPQIHETELHARLAAFQEVCEALKASKPEGLSPFQHVMRGLTAVGRLPQTVVVEGTLHTLSQNHINAFLSDLSAAELTKHVSLEDPRQVQQEQEERRLAATLYLATCSQETIPRIWKIWRDEAAFFRYVRQDLVVPPSRVVGWHASSSDQPTGPRDDDRPDWKTIHAKLCRNFPEASNHHEAGISLERKVWERASEVTSPSADQITVFWELLCEKLNSGFPYYAFRSRFAQWWKQCVRNGQFDQKEKPTEKIDAIQDSRKQPSKSEEPTETECPEPELELEKALRFVREGYRLVRSTFFERSSARSVDDKEGWEKNEQLRKVVDALWSRYLAQLLGHKSPEKITDLAKQFHLTKNTLYTLNRRLHIRLEVHTRARYNRLSNLEILQAERPPDRERRGATKTPYAEETGVLPIASLARAIPHEHTLLWVFTARVFLHPKIEPQHTDSWSFRRYVRELWSWVNDGQFDEIVRRGAIRGNRADTLAFSAMQREPLRTLLEELRGYQTERALEEDYLPHRGFEKEQSAAMALLRELVGDGGLHACQEASLRRWQQLLGHIGTHWVVPIWYLTFVEQVDKEALLYQLKVDTVEERAVVHLFQEMAALRATQPADISQATVGCRPARRNTL